MDKLDNYYTQRVSQSDDLLYQVGKTVQGKPVSERQIGLIVEGIVARLELSADDAVADLGCGNGLLTNFIASEVRTMLGVERNSSLYEQACRHVSHPNTSFLRGDVLCLSKAQLPVNKAYCYELIQHLGYREAAAFISQLLAILPAGGKLLVGGIPDEQRKWDFYNTQARREGLAKALIETGDDPMGTWFTPGFFQALASTLSVDCIVLDQHPDLYTSHYRFDCVFRGR
ncbi:MAG: class I SAM-dependent methyltransferase [Pseudomonas putida]|jgi:cyclopropane fatty-acyl-phospholipid synthase-like methyltransferase|nr:class I SAM-dependent methyltransferase [Pseudomonas putida]